jgi:hypothetical protein
MHCLGPEAHKMHIDTSEKYEYLYRKYSIIHSQWEIVFTRQ